MKRPLAAVCCVFAITQLIAAGLPLALLIALAAAFLILSGLAIGFHRSGYTKILPVVCLAALAVHMAGCWMLEENLPGPGSSHWMTVRTETIRPGFVDGMSRADLRVIRLDGRQLWPWQQFQVQCNVFPADQIGDVYQGKFLLKELEQNRYTRKTLADGVYLRAEAELVGYEGRSVGISSWFRQLNRRFSEGIRAYLPAQEGAVLAAMTTGDKSGLPLTLKTAYRTAGVSHLLVVSGLHLSLICGAFLGNRPIAGRFRRSKAVFAMGIVLLVIGLTGATPSILRAGTAALICYLGALLLLPADSLTSLGIAAFCASLAGPYALWNPGLQLSFAATLGVVMAAEAVKRMKYRAGEDCPFWKKVGIRALGLVLCPLMAALFTLPIQLLSGMSVSGVSVLTNLLCTALVGPILICGLAAGFCSLLPFLDFAVRVFALAGGLLVRLLNQIVFFCGELPFAKLRLPRGFACLLWIGCAMAILFIIRAKCGRKSWVALGTAVLCSVLLYQTAMYGVIQINTVGRANAPCLIAVQKKQTLAVLRGGESNLKYLRKELEERGVETVDLLVDLRERPEGDPIPAENVLRLSDVEKYTGQTHDICDIMATVIRLKQGGLLILDVQGYKIAVEVGNCTVGSPLPVDLMISGSGRPKAVNAQILICGTEQDWHSDCESKIYYAPEGASVMLRPGRSVLIDGGDYAV